MGVPPPKTNLRLAEKAAVKYYASGVREFSRVFAELDKYKVNNQKAPEPSPASEQVEDDLESWLDEMHLEDGTREQFMRCGSHSGRPKVIYEDVVLYRCSWCGNPSAGLRKCGQTLFSFHGLLTAIVISRQRLREIEVSILLRNFINKANLNPFARYCDSGCQKAHWADHKKSCKQ